MKVLITRPVEDAGPLAAKLQALGHEPFVVPVLAIQARTGAVVTPRAYQAIALTSANAVRVMKDDSILLNVPLFAVGPQSMKAALDKDFHFVEAHGGDVAGLLHYLTSHLHPQNGPVLYLSGAETSGDLEGRLQMAGFEVDRLVTYDAVPAKLDFYRSDIAAADAVVLYSPRTAKLWAAEVHRLDLSAHAAHIKHLCLSANVAANLPQSWPRAIAEMPVESALLSLLDCKAKAE